LSLYIENDNAKNEKTKKFITFIFVTLKRVKKTDYNRHLLTIKHKNNALLKNDNEKNEKIYTFDKCQKDYTCIV
jgi:hypothetical protein